MIDPRKPDTSLPGTSRRRPRGTEKPDRPLLRLGGPRLGRRGEAGLRAAHPETVARPGPEILSGKAYLVNGQHVVFTASRLDNIDFYNVDAVRRGVQKVLDREGLTHVVSDNGNSLWMRQTATGSNVQILPSVPNRYVGLTFSPDGNYVYLTREDGRLTYSTYRIATLGGQPPQPVIRDVDRMSIPHLGGAVVDFTDTIEQQGFTIDNPNAGGGCACGNSFCG